MIFQIGDKVLHTKTSKRATVIDKYDVVDEYKYCIKFEDGNTLIASYKDLAMPEY